MAQYTIPFYGERRGAARVQSGAKGLTLALSLRPETGKIVSEPTAALIASAEGKTARIDLEKGAGSAEGITEIAVLLICSADEGGREHIAAEGVRAGFDRRRVERLKEKLRTLRKNEAERAAPAVPALREKTAAETEKPLFAVACQPEGSGKNEEAPQTEESAAPRSEALKEILKRAEDLFPEGSAAAGHFASDGPFETPFLPRPLAAKATRPRSRPAGSTSARDETWYAAVREMRKGDKLSGVGRPEGVAEPLFPLDFPGVVFRRVCWPGSCRYYLEGRGMWEGKRAVFYALPGEACPAAPFERRGFHRFLRDKNGSGYWVKIRFEG